MTGIERTSTFEILSAMAVIAEQAAAPPCAGIAYQIAVLIHDEEQALSADATERLLHIGAALLAKTPCTGEMASEATSIMAEMPMAEMPA